MIDKFKNKFIEEATDNVQDLEDSLLLLDNNKEDSELIERIFRAMHTIKGGGDMFGFTELGGFVHHMEHIYDLVRTGQIKVTQHLLDVTLSSVDHIKVLLSNDELSPEIKQQEEELLKQIEQIVNGKSEDKPATQKEAEVQTTSGDELKTYFIHFEPDNNVFDNGTNPLFLLDELNTLGECKVFANLTKIPEIKDINPEFCYTYWEVILVTAEGVNAISDVFIFVEDQCNLEIHEIYNGNILQNTEFVNKTTEYVQKNTDIGISQIQAIIKELEPKVSETKKQKTVQTAKSGASKDNVITSIRVSSAKLDQLMNLVSEMVTTQAQLSLYAEKQGENELMTISENMQKLSRQLRDNAFDIALVPVETMLTRFQRLVRDLSNKLDKEIEFVAEGAETELDKTIIESLTDPLLHILRNSIDHGIEHPDEREKNGKPRCGKIILKAYYSGASVYISVKDDGAGIDPDKIAKKAIDSGLITSTANLSKKDILELTFASGFSTAKNVTNVSGRGVGMDVVKRKISEIRGEVEIDSEINVGTTITIKLPLTLSIIDGLLVKIMNEKFIIPLSSVDKIYSVEHEKVKTAFNDIIELDGRQVPFYYLREEFDLEENTDKFEQVIIVQYEEHEIGIVVDYVIGEYQAVLKSLGKMYRNQEIISGATILGDGTVALVLDTNKLISRFSAEELSFKQQIK